MLELLQQVFDNLCMLGIVVALHILLGTFNNVVHNHVRFSWPHLWYGLSKAVIFTLCIIGLSYIVVHADILPDDMSPAVLIETGVIFYAVKVFNGLKNMLMPGTEAKSYSDLRNTVYEDSSASFYSPSAETLPYAYRPESAMEGASTVTPIDIGTNNAENNDPMNFETHSNQL